MVDALLAWDVRLFLYLNGSHGDVLDSVMAVVTSKYTWIPLYLALIAVSIRCFRRRAPIVLLAAVLAVGGAELVTGAIMKPAFECLRPCHDASLREQVHLVIECGGRYGFASGHASDSFAAATFFSLLLRRFSAQALWLFAWAALVSYSRVYVGVHYPLDIAVGALVGALVGAAVGALCGLALRGRAMSGEG